MFQSWVCGYPQHNGEFSRKDWKYEEELCSSWWDPDRNWQRNRELASSADHEIHTRKFFCKKIFLLIYTLQDLFFISPFYHLVFPFERFIVTDADIQVWSENIRSTNHYELKRVKVDGNAKKFVFYFFEFKSDVHRAIIREIAS